jgi:hypothetical protein
MSNKIRFIYTVGTCLALSACGKTPKLTKPFGQGESSDVSMTHLSSETISQFHGTGGGFQGYRTFLQDISTTVLVNTENSMA